MMRYHQQILVRPPSSIRREPLLKPRPSFSTLQVSGPVNGNGGGKKITMVDVAEAAGSTAAECLAVSCCCPCGIVNLVVWMVCKVPVNLCRKAWRRRRRQQLIKKGLLCPKGRKLSCGCQDRETKLVSEAAMDEMAVFVAWKKDEVVDRLEEEMWERFYNTGFWRSPSQREVNHKKVC
ncbi:hypothetical protein MLD38_015984 [Melastoma candidum]|uniref:Uncharacterized protein n=1 Tax=Melastoma candidum TaxID=119954 RepID=A0ACB9RL09_9MYRT|nr:hypothetical protein MLD38_015984 [Melastoma candidum]